MKISRLDLPKPYVTPVDDHRPGQHLNDAHVEDWRLKRALEILVARPRPRWMRPDEDDPLAMPA